MPLREFARVISDQAEVSIVVESALDEHPITLEIDDQPIEQVIGSVARRVGAQTNRTGNLYFIGQLRPEDRGVLVRRVRRLNGEQLKAAVAVLQGPEGRVAVYDDGLVVMGDRVEVLARVHELLEQVEATVAPTWVVQLHFVGWSADRLIDFGLDVEPALDVSLAFATGSGTLGAASALSGSKLRAGLDAVLRAKNEGGGVDVVAEPCFLLVDGGGASFSRGDRIPLARRTVSNQGTVTTQGFDFIQTGLDVKVKLREMGPAEARLEVESLIGELKGISAEGGPITVDERFSTAAVVRSGGCYLLGSVNRVERRDTVQGAMQIGDKRSNGSQVVQIWARTFRIGGAAGGATASAPERAERSTASPASVSSGGAPPVPAPLPPLVPVKKPALNFYQQRRDAVGAGIMPEAKGR